MITDTYIKMGYPGAQVPDIPFSLNAINELGFPEVTSGPVRCNNASRCSHKGTAVHVLRFRV